MFISNYFRSRHRGTASVRTVFWRDMLLIGTIINVITLAVSMLYLSQDGNLLTFFLIYLSPMPYNIFILYSVWRCAARLDQFHAMAAKLLSLCWFFAFALL